MTGRTLGLWADRELRLSGPGYHDAEAGMGSRSPGTPDRGISTPVLLLTAKSQVADRIAGLDSGADDYLTKPFAIEELLARMRVAFKHSEGSNIAKKTILQVQKFGD